jgi:hypothetical protein
MQNRSGYSSEDTVGRYMRVALGFRTSKNDVDNRWGGSPEEITMALTIPDARQ